jgi:hypothetical protein
MDRSRRSVTLVSAIRCRRTRYLSREINVAGGPLENDQLENQIYSRYLRPDDAILTWSAASASMCTQPAASSLACVFTTVRAYHLRSHEAHLSRPIDACSALPGQRIHTKSVE